MNWLKNLSKLHVEVVTLFTKLDSLSENVDGLADDLKETAYKVARVEGAIAASGNPELMRQMEKINERLTNIEIRLSKLEPVEDQNSPVRITHRK